MKRAGKLRKEGKSAKQALKTAWKEEKGGSTSKATKPKAKNRTEEPRKKFLGLF